MDQPPRCRPFHIMPCQWHDLPCQIMSVGKLMINHKALNRVFHKKSDKPTWNECVSTVSPTSYLASVSHRHVDRSSIYTPVFWNGSCCRFEDKKHIIMWSDRFLLWIVEWSLWGGASAMHGCLSWELWQGKLELLVAEGLETHSDPCDIRCVAVMCARHLASKDFHRVFASRLSSLLKMVERFAHVGYTGMVSEHIPEGYPNSFQYFTISCTFVLLCLIGSEVNCASFDQSLLRHFQMSTALNISFYYFPNSSLLFPN
jgi:hypothetical protein